MLVFTQTPAALAMKLAALAMKPAAPATPGFFFCIFAHQTQSRIDITTPVIYNEIAWEQVR